MIFNIDGGRAAVKRSPMLYGQFLEHFHRQVYGGVYEPGSPLSDADGFRTDVIDALKKISVPVIRWPGGCFVSSYHWQNGVGERVPSFDKAWRVEDSNTFGTDEFVKFCRKLGCEPYICTNAGTGTAEEMSDWMEYCNLDHEGQFARMRIANGSRQPFKIKYWSIGNENYGNWEIGAKDSREWSRLVLEASKMLKHIDPDAELSAAALDDLDWNVALLKAAGERLSWMSLHGYWDPLWNDNNPADYQGCMSYTVDMDKSIRRLRGLLTAMGLEKRIKIAFDEWNLRGWHHPRAHTVEQGRTPEEYLLPRDKNDDNATYTMADAVFTACFLNVLLRNADIVGMANYAPVVNTRGLVYTYPEGIVKRSTYHVFDLYVNYMGDEVLDCLGDGVTQYTVRGRAGEIAVDAVDIAATRNSSNGSLAVSAINKYETDEATVELKLKGCRKFESAKILTVNGNSADDYNDVERDNIFIRENKGVEFTTNADGTVCVRAKLEPHSVNVIILD